MSQLFSGKDNVSNVLIQWWLVIERNMPDFGDYRVANWWPM